MCQRTSSSLPRRSSIEGMSAHVPDAESRWQRVRRWGRLESSTGPRGVGEIDTVIPMRVLETQGKGKDRRDCMRRFRAAWDRFAADEANLIEFLNAKRRRR